MNNISDLSDKFEYWAEQPIEVLAKAKAKAKKKRIHISFSQQIAQKSMMEKGIFHFRMRTKPAALSLTPVIMINILGIMAQ